VQTLNQAGTPRHIAAGGGGKGLQIVPVCCICALSTLALPLAQQATNGGQQLEFIKRCRRGWHCRRFSAKRWTRHHHIFWRLCAAGACVASNSVYDIYKARMCMQTNVTSELRLLHMFDLQQIPWLQRRRYNPTAAAMRLSTSEVALHLK
jgi:hypothetical protein